MWNNLQIKEVVFVINIIIVLLLGAGNPVNLSYRQIYVCLDFISNLQYKLYRRDLIPPVFSMLIGGNACGKCKIYSFIKLYLQSKRCIIPELNSSQWQKLWNPKSPIHFFIKDSPKNITTCLVIVENKIKYINPLIVHEFISILPQINDC